VALQPDIAYYRGGGLRARRRRLAFYSFTYRSSCCFLLVFMGPQIPIYIQAKNRRKGMELSFWASDLKVCKLYCRFWKNFVGERAQNEWRKMKLYKHRWGKRKMSAWDLERWPHIDALGIFFFKQ